MRLHSLIYATIANVPIMGISYDPKIKGYMDYSGQDTYIDIKNLDFDKTCKMIDDILENYTDAKEKLAESYEMLRERAAENGAIAIELYEKGSVGNEQ